MSNQTFKRVVPGGQISARSMNAALESVERFERLTSNEGYTRTAGGTILLGAPIDRFMIRITSGIQPYLYEEVFRDTVSTWAVNTEGFLADSLSDSLLAREINGITSVPAGSVVEAFLANSGDHLLFFYPATSTGGMGTVTSVGLAFPGAAFITITSSPVTTSGILTGTWTGTTGDILYASAADTWGRRSIGTTDQVLLVAAGLPTWTTASGGGPPVGTGRTLTATSPLSIGGTFGATADLSANRTFGLGGLTSIGSPNFVVGTNAAASAWEYKTAGTTANCASADIQEAFWLSGDTTPAQITSNQNDYNPPNLATATVLRLSSDAARDITGLAGGADGRIIRIHNVGTNDITLKDESVSSAAANRFALQVEIMLKADQVVELQYDATSSRWRALGMWSATGTGITTLNTLTAAVQTFAVGTAGTDFNIVSAVSTHTFNLPDASAANRGAVTTGTQTFGGAKTFNTTVTINSSGTGIRELILNDIASQTVPSIEGRISTGTARIRIFTNPPPSSTDIDAAYMFDSTTPSGAFAYNAGTPGTVGALFFGINASIIGTRDTTKIGGYFTLSIQAALPYFLVNREAIGSSDPQRDLVIGTDGKIKLGGPGDLDATYTYQVNCISGSTIGGTDTSNIANVLNIGHRSESGAIVAGFGARAVYTLKSTTTADTLVVHMDAVWVSPTHATRTARWLLASYDTAARECIRAEATGTDVAPGRVLIGVGGVSSTTHVFTVTLVDDTTNSASGHTVLRHNSSGVVADGFGSAFDFQLETTTTENTDAASVRASWATAAHATRKARLAFFAFDTAARECIRMEGSGTAAMIGFLGASAVVRQSVTGSRNANAALESVLTGLANEGLITDSSTAGSNPFATFSGVRVYNFTNSPITTGAAGEDLTMDSENFDTDAFHDNATNNDRITIPVAGKYFIGAVVGWVPSGLGAGERNIAILLNGLALTGEAEAFNIVGINDGLWHSVHTILDLAVNDILRINAAQTSGFDLALDGGHVLCYRIG